jgi:hypothetical protein
VPQRDAVLDVHLSNSDALPARATASVQVTVVTETPPNWNEFWVSEYSGVYIGPGGDPLAVRSSVRLRCRHPAQHGITRLAVEPDIPGDAAQVRRPPDSPSAAGGPCVPG